MLLPGQDVAEWGVARVGAAFALALGLAAPFVIAAVLYNLALGVINKAMPQLMVALVGAPRDHLRQPRPDGGDRGADPDGLARPGSSRSSPTPCCRGREGAPVSEEADKPHEPSQRKLEKAREKGRSRAPPT